MAITECPDEPANTLGSADGRFLFVSLRGSGELASYQVEQDSGKLQLLNIVPAGDDPAYLLLDRTGRFLLTAYYVSNKVTVHAISSDGKLSDQPVDSRLTAQNAHGICIDSTNSFVRVSHTGSNRIDQFRFDSKTGKLTPLDPPFVVAPAGQNPRHIVLHPSDRWAYCSNEAGATAEDGASCYECDRQSGQLRILQSISSLPEEFDAMQNSTAECLLTSDGKFLYVANRGHNSLAGFAVDQASGKLTRVSITPTEAVPRSFAISSDSRFLYAAGEATGKIACFCIESDGRLNRFDTVDSGPVSWCITCVG
jgi:6-phosphogluconolactonase